jgi:hypothetical protein
MPHGERCAPSSVRTGKIIPDRLFLDDFLCKNIFIAIRLRPMVRIPHKLKNDPIVEALFEVRFTGF